MVDIENVSTVTVSVLDTTTESPATVNLVLITMNERFWGSRMKLKWE